MRRFIIVVAFMMAAIPAIAQELGQVYVNPYGIAPLTAIIADGGQVLDAVSVTVQKKSVNGVDISYNVNRSSLLTHGGIPIFGLYPDYNNKVNVVYSINGTEYSKRYTIYAAPLNLPVSGGIQQGSLGEVVPVKVDDAFKNRLYLINHIARVPGDGKLKWNSAGGAGEWDWTSYNWITDTAGDVRWYMDIEKLHNSDVVGMQGATMGFHQTSDGNLIWVMAQSYMKYDLMGRKIWHRQLPPKFCDASHEITETPLGTYLIRVAASNYLREDGKTVRTVRDHIIEVNENGDVVDYWDLNTILDPYRDKLLLALDRGAICLNIDASQIGQTKSKAELEDPNAPFGDLIGVGPGRNWAHVNSISYDIKDDSIVISARHQGIAKIGRDKKVKWILASPDGWTGELASKVLKPVNSDGEAIECPNNKCPDGFDWSWTQHTAYVIPEKGTLSVFDNGDARGMMQPVFPTDKYSRAVEYRIDEENMTVEQVWEFGKEAGYAWYSPITSIVEYLADTDTMLVYSASIGMFSEAGLDNRLHEVPYGSKVSAVELNIKGHIKGGTGYRATVIKPNF